MSVKFAIEQVYDLSQRGVILAVGRMLEGRVAGRTTLCDQRTGLRVQILGVELLPPPAGRPDRVTLIVDPKSSSTRPATGMMLVEPA
jgi:hypothetical protein